MKAYNIQAKNDFARGAYLTTKIPQAKVDKNALYVISAEKPEFLLPFTYKNIDGDMELVYEIGTHSKLVYYRGEMCTQEYIELMTSLLTPLLNCGDWFMETNSFIFNIDYIYYDKNKNSVLYVYLPQIPENNEEHTFGEMIASVSKVISSYDTLLENKMLRAILEKYNPSELIRMLAEYNNQQSVKKETNIQSAVQTEMKMEKVVRKTGKSEKASKEKAKTTEIADIYDGIEDIDEADFNASTDGREEKARSGKTVKNESGMFRFFTSKNKKKESLHSLQSGNIVHMPELEPIEEDSIEACEEKPELNRSKLLSSNQVVDTTESLPMILDFARLKCVGKADLPKEIDVTLNEGGIFSIGRYDAAIGKAQSTFEFDKKVKAISRRHAVIERDGEVYKIIDLASKSGTFIDGQKLPPNTPYNLIPGAKVSFGNYGVDYVWDVG